jgi:hypothetical protein
MLILLTVISALVVVLFFGALAIYLIQISTALEAIGGASDSFLAKLAFGLRAIEQETGYLPGEVTKLNATLTAVAGGLQQVDMHLVDTIEAVVNQKEGM